MAIRKQKGSVSIDAQNIMPVIKRWLYSDKDIFLREAVSNACDAITKFRMLHPDSEEEMKVNVAVDTEQKTITISDIGTQPAIDVEYQEQNQTLVQPEHEHTAGFEPQHIAKEPSEPSFSIENSEKDLIKKCLEKYNYNRKLAAIELGISERTLYRRIKDYGL